MPEPQGKVVVTCDSGKVGKLLIPQEITICCLPLDFSLWSGESGKVAVWALLPVCSISAVGKV